MVDLVESAIPGLLILSLDVHQDSRGWFKENWQRQKMGALGLPDFEPVQNNVSFNARRGSTRGIHTEPWDKLVSVSAGRVFAAWVDMRAGETFGTVHSMEMGPETAVFVPRGVGNSYQALEDGTVYSYLVNAHWKPGRDYPALNLADPTVAIPWPIPLSESDVSVKDQQTPLLEDVSAVPELRTLIIGANGQLGRALADLLPHADLVDAVPDADRGVALLDLSDAESLAAMPWDEYGTVLNAAAYTSVDAAETAEGRTAAWTVNAAAPALLARVAREHRLLLVHYSSEYVFDGTAEVHTEEEALSPLGVYAQSKAAGDLAVATAPRHYLIRTSWVVGEGRNFVRTMLDLARRGVCPEVVDDQVGRLTFASELARATSHLVDNNAPFGTYNVTNSGDPMSWYDVAVAVYELAGRSGHDVKNTSSAAFAEGKDLAPRPQHSVLALDKLEATGFRSVPATDALRDYCRSH